MTKEDFARHLESKWISDIEDAIPENDRENNRSLFFGDNGYWLDLGEFAFLPDCEDEWEYEQFWEDVMYSIKAVDGVEDVRLHTWSSKSGTSVLVKMEDDLDCIKQDIEYTIADVMGWGDLTDNCVTYKQLQEISKDLNDMLPNNSVAKRIKAVEDVKSEAYKVACSYAKGVRSGSFSNGETVFVGINKHEGVAFAGKYTDPVMG